MTWSFSLSSGDGFGSTPPPLPGDGTFLGSLERLTAAAEKVLIFLQQTVEGQLLDYLTRIAVVLAFGVMVVAFLRLLREHEGAGFETALWSVRAVICLALIGSAPALVAWMSGFGRGLAFGQAETPAYLGKLVREERLKFEENYSRCVDNVFLVRVPRNGQTDMLLPVQPVPDAEGGAWFGLVDFKELSAKDLDSVDSRFNLQKTTVSQAFTWFKLGRAILEFSNFFLVVIVHLSVLGCRLASPFYAAVAIDKHLAQRMTWNFCWGTVVLTVFLPVILRILQLLAYSSANVAFSLADDKPAAVWDPRTLTAVTQPGSDPVFIIGALAFTMALAGLLMIAAPVLAYKLSTGQVYESVSSTVGGWIGAATSTGVGIYSASAGAALSNQAETLQINAQAQSASAQAAARRETADRAAAASADVTRASHRASAVQAAAGIEGGRVTSVRRETAQETFALKAFQSSMTEQKDLTRADTRYQQHQQRLHGEERIVQAEAGYAVDSQRRGFNALEQTGQVAGSGMKTGPGMLVQTGMAGFLEGAGAINNERPIDFQRQFGTLIPAVYSQAHNSNLRGLERDKTKAYDDKLQRDESAEKLRANDTIAGINEGADIQQGGVAAALGINLAAADRKETAELTNNRTLFNAETQAARVVQESGLSAAALKSASQLVGAAGHQMQKNIDKATELRY